MDYSKLTNNIVEKVTAAMVLINNPEVAPEVRQLNQEILFREVGQAIYDKVYDMNAFDMEIQHTKGAGIDDRYFGMAKVASNSISAGKVGLEEYVNNYLYSAASKAQHDAMSTARQSGKHPTVTRTESGDACKWCQSKTGSFTDPSSDIFARHGGCNGRIVTKGYKARNGLLSNYKEGDSASAKASGAAAPITPSGGQVVFRGTGNNVNTSGGLLLGNALYVARDTTTAAKFGSVAQLSMPIKSKDILLISSDNQLDKLILDAQRWAVKGGTKSLDSNEFIPAYVRSLGFKAVEVKPTVDPLAGIAIVDPKIAKKMTK